MLKAKQCTTWFTGNTGMVKTEDMQVWWKLEIQVWWKLAIQVWWKCSDNVKIHVVLKTNE